MSGPARPLPWFVAPALLVLVGALLRVPSLALPLGPEDAVLVRAAEQLVEGRWPDLEGRGGLLPGLLLLPSAMGLPAGPSLRWLGLLLGALAPALLWALLTRLRLPARTSGLAALLLALHPLLIAYAGGAEAGAQGLALVLWLGALHSCASSAPGTRRWGLSQALLAALAWPGAWIYGAALLPWALRREQGLALRLALGIPSLALLTLCALRGQGEAGTPLGLLACVAALALLGLLPLLPSGVLRWVRQDAGQRPLVLAWLSGALAHALLLASPWLRPGLRLHPESWGPAVLLVPSVVAAGALGLAALGRVGRLRLEAAVLALALVGALFAGLGPAQSALLGEHAGSAGRLHALGAALRLAVREAGPEGWIAVDLGEASAIQAAALAPWCQGRPLWVTPDSGGPREPPAGWPEGGPRRIALLTVRPDSHSVTTLGGAGIFAQEPVGRVGPYHVLRVRRP